MNFLLLNPVFNFHIPLNSKLIVNFISFFTVYYSNFNIFLITYDPRVEISSQSLDSELIICRGGYSLEHSCSLECCQILSIVKCQIFIEEKY